MMDQMNNLADPKSGPCPFFNVGDEFILKRTPQQDDFYHLMEGNSVVKKENTADSLDAADIRNASIQKT